MNDSLRTIHELLLKFKPINEKYDKIAEITGERFNIFNILNVDTDEVGTHSAILCELLSPHGSHGYKESFLDIFISVLRSDFNKPFDLQTTTSSVTKETNIGFVNDTYDEGGKIDILIKDDTGNVIIIENKIHARDQYKQLVRYNNAYKNAPIFYLTLYGTKPSVESKGELAEGENYFCISYKDQIIRWLEECRKVAVNHPLLRETISQYIILIKQLTHQTISGNMKNEVVKLITENSNNIEAAFGLVESLDGVKEFIVDKFKNSLLEELKLIGQSRPEKGTFGLKEVELIFMPDCWSSHDIIIVFNRNYGELEIGIYRRDDQSCSDQHFRLTVRQRLKDLSNELRDDYENWVWHYQLSNWDDESWVNKYNGSYVKWMIEFIKNIIQNLENISL